MLVGVRQEVAAENLFETVTEIVLVHFASASLFDSLRLCVNLLCS